MEKITNGVTVSLANDKAAWNNTSLMIFRRAALFSLCALTVYGQFRAGVARRDITPQEPVPMWGYGDRHDALSTGINDPLHADALVLDVAGKKLAIVSLDLGRAPNERSLQKIRARIKAEAGIEQSFISGSHTHHGPVLELTDAPGKG